MSRGSPREDTARVPSEGCVLFSLGGDKGIMDYHPGNQALLSKDQRPTQVNVKGFMCLGRKPQKRCMLPSPWQPKQQNTAGTALRSPVTRDRQGREMDHGRGQQDLGVAEKLSWLWWLLKG